MYFWIARNITSEQVPILTVIEWMLDIVAVN